MNHPVLHIYVSYVIFISVVSNIRVDNIINNTD